MFSKLDQQNTADFPVSYVFRLNLRFKSQSLAQAKRHHSNDKCLSCTKINRDGYFNWGSGLGLLHAERTSKEFLPTCFIRHILISIIQGFLPIE